MEVRAHIIVKGLVQGVGFRYFVYSRATAAGTRGWVRNLGNGDVEIEAQGERSGVEILIGQVKAGPRSARVTDMRIEWKPPLEDATAIEIR
jgi:acylphosphatase